MYLFSILMSQFPAQSCHLPRVSLFHPVFLEMGTFRWLVADLCIELRYICMNSIIICYYYVYV